MDAQQIGKLILILRTEKGLTQRELADAIYVSDKAVSKWERGLGCPDISLLPRLSSVLGVNIEDILSGKLTLNEYDGGNMKKTRFFVCPECGNIVTCTGYAGISCCGRKLEPLKAQESTDSHEIVLEPVEDELYVTMVHEMTKAHSVSFLAYVTSDKLLIAKMYPEQNAATRFKNLGSGSIYAYCNQHGLFTQKIK